MGQNFHTFMFPWFAFAQKQLEHLNLFPESIIFHPLTIPHVDGFPPGAETFSDIPILLWKFLPPAIDLTRGQVETAVLALCPDVILFDIACWVNVISATSIAHDFVQGGELGVPPPGYTSSKLLYREHDAHALLSFSVFYKRFSHRLITGLMNCDFIYIRTCKDIEGNFYDYIESQYHKKDKSKPLEAKWNHWLSRFGKGSVVYCALGSQNTNLEKDQFQELCLGIELTGYFVSHCGFGSRWESLMSDCQIVLLPFLADQVLNTRLMSEELKVSVEVEREETGWFSKESLSVAITSVMDQDSKIGSLVRRNHSKLKEVLVSDGLLTGYTDKLLALWSI
ncbi:hypothetical protein CARUB_v10021749mg [Capsella rubella]|uniref:Uncharacterized protein n=1 Tax=Capsella rubella TaxID=81985 RepID=R0GEJ8_9BRAS|nr:hypothetical protein CARUB_v10021749mg [Capsella rubella]